MVQDRQPLLHPRLLDCPVVCSLSNGGLVQGLHSESRLSVEVARYDSDVFFVVAVSFDVFVHLLDVLRVSRVGGVHTGQFYLALIGIDCCGDHPFADVLCLRYLSFSSLVQEYSNSVLFSEATSAHKNTHIFICGRFLLFVSCLHVQKTGVHLHPSSSLRSSSNLSALFKLLAFFCATSNDLSE